MKTAATGDGRSKGDARTAPPSGSVRTGRLAVALAWWLVSAVALLAPGSARSTAPEWLLRLVENGGDKLVHLAIFLLLGWLVARSVVGRRRAVWATMVGCGAWGVLTELLQAEVAYRGPEALDAVANLVGVAGGIAVALARERGDRAAG